MIIVHVANGRPKKNQNLEPTNCMCGYGMCGCECYKTETNAKMGMGMRGGMGI